VGHFVSEQPGHFTSEFAFVPYFQYRIGPYNADLYLYFPKEPFPLLYKNEIFNKLQEYSGYDIIRYLEFHYSAYPDKVDFLRFLQYEISERLEREPENVRLVSAIKWVTEKKEVFQKKEDQNFRAEIEQDVRAILRAD
jgi:predicted transcriptional regulator